MTDPLRARIATIVADELVRQSEYSHRYVPMDDEGNDLPERIGLDGSIDPAVLADAVIRELDLDTVVALAQDWYNNYDVTPANDPRNPSDVDIAYDDAGYQILVALGLEKPVFP